MKEFEKWWDKQVVPPGSTLEPRIVWKAALEWAVSRGESADELYELVEAIERELSG